MVGQNHVTDLLENAVKNGAVSHAYLFTGPRGTGKTSVARILAHAVNALPYDDDSTHLDIIEIDAASNRRIDDIRDLREKVHIAPTSAKYKVYIIDEVHMLTGESFNALLKTLEEPPSHVIFILATTELHKVPATIVSRTQRYHFRPGSAKDIAAHLAFIANKESVHIDDKALSLIAEHSAGGFRDAVSLLDQTASLGKEMITHTMVEQLLGLTPGEEINRILVACRQHDAATAIRTIKELYSLGGNATTISAQLSKAIQSDEHSRETYDLLYDLVEIPKSYAPELKLIATIGRHCSQQAQTEMTAPQHHTNAAPKNTRSASPPPPQQEAATPVTKPPKPLDTPAIAPSGAADSTFDQPINWPDVVADIHQQAPALHSILKNADVSQQQNTLTLTFSRAFYSKKMQDEKHRHALASSIAKLYGSAPEIIITSGTKALSDDAKGVADIMGGGEMVSL